MTWNEKMMNAMIALWATFYEKVVQGSNTIADNWQGVTIFHTPLGDNRVVSWMVGNVLGNVVYISDYKFGVDSRVVQVMTRGLKRARIRTIIEALMRGAQEDETHYLRGKQSKSKGGGQGPLDDFLDLFVNVVTDPAGLVEAIMSRTFADPVAEKGDNRWAMARDASNAAMFLVANKCKGYTGLKDVEFAEFMSDTIPVKGVPAREFFAGQSVYDLITTDLTKVANQPAFVPRLKADTTAELVKAQSSLRAAIDKARK